MGSEQCEDPKQNGERWEGRKWQLQILEQRFLEGQSLVELALTSNSGLKLDQQEVQLLPLINPRLNLLLLRRSLLLRCQKTKTEPLLTISLESAHRIVRSWEFQLGLYCTAWQLTTQTSQRQRSRPTPRSSSPPFPASTPVKSVQRT